MRQFLGFFILILVLQISGPFFSYAQSISISNECQYCMQVNLAEDCTQKCSALSSGGSDEALSYTHFLDALTNAQGDDNPFVRANGDTAQSVQLEFNYRKTLRLQACSDKARKLSSVCGSEFKRLSEQFIAKKQTCENDQELRDISMKYGKVAETCYKQGSSTDMESICLKLCSTAVQVTRNGRIARSEAIDFQDKVATCHNITQLNKDIRKETSEAFGEIARTCTSGSDANARDDSGEVDQLTANDFLNSKLNEDDPLDDYSAKDDDDELGQSKKTSPSQQINNTMAQVRQFSQIAQPFLGQQNPQGQGIDYSYNLNTYTRPQQTGYRPQAEIAEPDYTSIGDDPSLEPDLPLPKPPPDFGDPSNNSGASNQRAANNRGGGVGVLGSGNNQNKPRRSANRGRRQRRRSKGGKTIFSRRLQEQDSAGYSGAAPSKTTARASRVVSRDRNGNKVDKRFNPSKYQVKIDQVYQKALHSPAMKQARRRAAGHVSDIKTSRGYRDWHKTYHIHPKSLSIFKQMRVCYIIKYSSYSGACGASPK